MSMVVTMSASSTPTTLDSALMAMTQAAKLRPSPAVPGSMEAAVKMWLQVGNIQKLQQAVLDGYGWLLEKQTSRLPHVNKFIKRVPDFQLKIDALHEQVIRGELASVRRMLDKKGWAMAKDHYGHSILHKAVMANQGLIVDLVLQDYPELVLAKDNEGRTALHYAAALQGTTGGSNELFENIVKAGAQENIVDVQGHSPSYYRSHPQAIRHRTVMSRRSRQRPSMMTTTPTPGSVVTTSTLVKGDPDSATSPSKLNTDDNAARRLPDVVVHNNDAHDKDDKDDKDDNDKDDKIKKREQRSSQLTNMLSLMKVSEQDKARVREALMRDAERDVLLSIPGTPQISMASDIRASDFRTLSTSSSDDEELDKKKKKKQLKSKSTKHVLKTKDSSKILEKLRPVNTKETLDTVMSKQSVKSHLPITVSHGALKSLRKGKQRVLVSKASSLTSIAPAKRQMLKPLEKQDHKSRSMVSLEEKRNSRHHDLKSKLLVNSNQKGSENVASDPRNSMSRSKSKMAAFMRLDKTASKVTSNSKLATSQPKLATSRSPVRRLSLLTTESEEGEATRRMELMAAARRSKKLLVHLDKTKEKRDDNRLVSLPLMLEKSSRTSNKSVKSMSLSRSLVFGDADEEFYKDFRLVFVKLPQPKEGLPLPSPNRAYLRTLIHNGDVEHLEKVVLDGHGNKLLHESAANAKIHKFLQTLPDFMDTISILHNATTSGLLSVVEELLSSERLAVSRDAFGSTVLHKAVLFYQPKIVKLVAERFPITTRAKDQEGRTPLHYAAALEDSGIFYRYLLKCGADEHAQDKFGRTAKFYVYAPSELDVAALAQRSRHMSRKREPSPDSRKFSMVPKNILEQEHLAHVHPHRSLTTNQIRSWIRQADMAKLEQAVLDGHGHRLLGEVAADNNVRAFLRSVPAYMHRITEVHLAVVNNDLHSLEKHLTRRKLAVSKDDRGFGLLHKAVFMGHKDIVLFLLHKFPETTDVRDWDGRVALHYTASNDRAEELFPLVARVQQQHSDLLVTDDKGKSVQYYREHRAELHIPEWKPRPIPAQGPITLPPNPKSSKQSNLKAETRGQRSRRAPHRASLKGEKDVGNVGNVRKGEMDKEDEKNVDNVVANIDGVEITSANIRIWIHEKDTASLERVLFEGHGSLLLRQTSSHPRVKRFLEETAAKLMDDVHLIHKASIDNELEPLLNREFRQSVYTARDKNGLTAFHKAVANGHKEVAQHLMEKTDCDIINTTDLQGRTALHYAAAVAQEENGRAMYKWLVEHGADPNRLDDMMRSASYYLTHGSLIRMDRCTKLPDTSAEARAAKGRQTRASVGKEMSSKVKESPKSFPEWNKISKENVSKWIKVGDVERLEHAVYMGKGVFTKGKAAWNEDVRRFLKTVPALMASLEHFHSSASLGSLAELETQMSKDARLKSSRDVFGRTALHKAAMGGHVDVVLLLLEPDLLRALDKEKRNALHYAFRAEDKEKREKIVDILNKAGVDANALDSFSHTPSFYMEHEFTRTDEESVRAAAGESKSMVSVGESTVTAEDEAEAAKAVGDADFVAMVDLVLKGKGELLKFASTEDEEVQDFLNSVAAFQEKIALMHEAVVEGSLDRLRRHLDRKKFALAIDPRTGLSLLHKAVVLGHEQIVRFLCETVPKTTAIRDFDGRSVLHMAAMLHGDNGRLFDHLKTLLTQDDVHLRDKKGKMAEDYLLTDAVSNGLELRALAQMATFEPLRVSGKDLQALLKVPDAAKTSPAAQNSFDEAYEASDFEDMTRSPNEVGSEVLLHLDKGLRRLRWARSSGSLLKRFLTQPVLERLKKRVSVADSNLYECIKMGLDNVDHELGVAAVDAHVYSLFWPLFKPLLATYHHLDAKVGQPSNHVALRQTASGASSGRLKLQPQVDVDHVIVTVARNIEGENFVCKMSTTQLKAFETDMKLVLLDNEVDTDTKEKEKESLKYVSLEDITERESMSCPIPDAQPSEWLSTEVFRDWPKHRGVFVPRQVGGQCVWLGHIEHLKVVVKEKDLDEALHNADSLLNRMELKVQRANKNFLCHSSRLGFVTCDPSLLGTGLSLSAVICSEANFVLDEDKVDKVQRDFGLKLDTADKGKNEEDDDDRAKGLRRWEVRTTRSFGVDESVVVSNFRQGINALFGRV